MRMLHPLWRSTFFAAPVIRQSGDAATSGGVKAGGQQMPRPRSGWATASLLASSALLGACASGGGSGSAAARPDDMGGSRVQTAVLQGMSGSATGVNMVTNTSVNRGWWPAMRPAPASSKAPWRARDAIPPRPRPAMCGATRSAGWRSGSASWSRPAWRVASRPASPGPVPGSWIGPREG